MSEYFFFSLTGLPATKLAINENPRVKESFLTRTLVIKYLLLNTLSSFNKPSFQTCANITLANSISFGGEKGNLFWRWKYVMGFRDLKTSNISNSSGWEVEIRSGIFLLLVENFNLEYPVQKNKQNTNNNKIINK